MKEFIHLFWFCTLSFQLSLFANTQLWEDEYVQVFEEQGLIKVSPKMKVCHISDLPEDTFVAMEKTIGKMETVFQQVFGKGDYVRSMTFHDSGGIKAILFPGGAYQQDDKIDVAVKVRVLLYQFFEDRQTLPPLSEEVLSKIATVAQRILPSDINTVPIPLPKGIFVYSNVTTACELLRESLIRLGENIPFELHEDISHFTSFTTPSSCPFCREDVLKKQKVAGTHLNSILINHYPYVDKIHRHYMIIPNHHISKISEQTDDEIRDFYRLVNKLDHISLTHYNIIENSNEKGIILTRTGWFGAQTVSHLHHHLVFFVPGTVQRWMRNLYFYLSKDGRSQRVSEEEFENIRSELARFFP